MAEPSRWSISDAQALVRSGGAAAVVDEVLARREHAPQPEAWISRPSPDALRTRAAEVDAALAAGADLPLAGVPFAVKDCIDVAGVETTAGCAAYAYEPSRSAPLVERLQSAGAIFAGKTNLDQFATGLVGTRSPQYGACRNPIDPTMIAGGSSSGSAIVVATGEVSFALATDTAGSGRVPAALCGLVGAKPAPGSLPTDGVVPAMASFDCVSILAGSVADASTVFGVWGLPTPGAVQAPVRLGIPAALDWCNDDDARACFDRTVERVVALGCSVTEVDAAPMQEAGALLYGSALVAERHAAFGEFALAHPDVVDPAVLDIVRRAGEHSGSDFARDLARLARLRRDVAQTWWSTVDALLLPTVARVPTFMEAIEDRFGPSTELGRLTAFVNPLGLAAVALPAGTRASGLPFGVSLVGPSGTDHDLMALAAAFGGETRPSADGSRLAYPPHRLAVVGAHLSGQPLNHQLTERNAVLSARTTTAPEYRLYALDTTPPKPGLVRCPNDGRAIEVEVWSLDAAGFGDFIAAIPAPLGVGKVRLVDGTEVTGFLCEPHAVEHAPDITELGGWRAYLAASSR
jgi:allophanate hydrolase